MPFSWRYPSPRRAARQAAKHSLPNPTGKVAQAKAHNKAPKTTTMPCPMDRKAGREALRPKMAAQERSLRRQPEKTAQEDSPGKQIFVKWGVLLLGAPPPT